MLNAEDNKTVWIALLLLIAITEYSSCCASRLNDGDVDVILKIIEDARPNLLKIVHDEAPERSRILGRIFSGINNNIKQGKVIPIHIATFGVGSMVNLLQNYTTFTVLIAGNNCEDKIHAIVSGIDARLHRKHLSQYLVVFHTVSMRTNDSKWPTKVFELFWERRELDVVILYRDENSLRLKSFNPFYSRVIDFNPNSSVNELYASKLLDLNGYQLNIIAFDGVINVKLKNNGTDFEGVDGKMMKFFGQK